MADDETGKLVSLEEARQAKRRKAGTMPVPADNDPLDYRLAFLPRNDTGNAERLRVRVGADLIYVDKVGWHWWDGQRWNAESGPVRARLLVQDTAAAIGGEIEALAKAKGKKAVGPAAIDDHRAWQLDSGNAARLRAMLDVAQPHLTRQPRELDADSWVINVANGTLPLDGLCEALRPARRLDLITKLVDVEFDPDAKCPLFDAFINEILPNLDVRSFVRRSLGYALTGDAGEQKMWVFHGVGANGKSTLVDLVARILGDYAVSLPFSSFIADDRKRGSEATPDLATLPGKRFVRASEPDKGAAFSESLIKTVTGGEEMPVRRLHQDFFYFKPEFKLFLSCNHKPRIRGQDEGIWRRINLVPFTVSIPLERRDKELGDKLWAERSGVLNWLIEGLLEWRNGGLRPPAAVVAATRDYREESDPIGLFLSSWCERVEKAETQATLLFEAYRLWCTGNAVEPMSQTLFGKMLPERGFEKNKGGTIRYLGIQLTEEAGLALEEERRRRAGHRRHSANEDD